MSLTFLYLLEIRVPYSTARILYKDGPAVRIKVKQTKKIGIKKYKETAATTKEGLSRDSSPPATPRRKTNMFDAMDIPSRSALLTSRGLI